MEIRKTIRFLVVLILLFLSIFLSDNSSANPLDHWHWRNPLPTGNSLSGMAFGNGVFVAVGGAGTILTSPDGIIWTSHSSGTTDSLLGVIYGNSIFVAVGDTGTILTSSDGATWAAQSSGTTRSLSRVAYGNGMFVAVGDAGVILTSADGITWTTRDSGSASRLNGIAYGNGIFVAVGGSPGCVVGPPCPGTPGIILTSVDGITWAPRFSGNPFSMVAYGNGIFVAMANILPTPGFNPSSYSAMILTSPDGTNWTQHPSPVAFVSDLAYGDGIFLAVGDQNVFTSPDGVTWTPQSSGTNTSLITIAYGKGIFVAGGFLGLILTSPDGVTWTTRSSGITDSFTGVTYGNGVFVAVGGSSIIGPSGSILTSLDGGISWLTRSSGSTNNLFGVAYGNGIFVAVGYAGEVSSSCPIGECATILTSSDGVTWTVRFSDTSGQSGTPPGGTSFRGVTYGNGVFVAVGYAVGPSRNLTGAIYTSSDGITWTARFFGSPIDFLLGVTYGNGTFVVAGEHGILTSPDAITWTTRLSDNSTSTWHYGVTYGNGIFVAVGGSGNGTTNVMTSPDGITWTPRSSGSDILSAVAYGNGIFVALVGGYTGAIPPTMLTSLDGITWTARFLGFYDTGVTYGNDTFVVVGQGGWILQSDPLSDNCTATLSPDLALHVPIINFNGTYLWADLSCESGDSGDLFCLVKDYGAANPNDFSSCQASTLTAEMNAHMPAGIYNNISYHADFVYIPPPVPDSQNGRMWFKLVSATKN